MTIDQFLEKLRQTPRDWRIIHGHQILSGGLRRGCTPKDYQCPLGAVLHPGKQAVIYANEYGHGLGLSPEDSQSLIYATDMVPDYDQRLRQQLLEACGLTP